MKAVLSLLVSLGLWWATACSALDDAPGNLLRNPGFEEDAAGWVLPKTFNVVQEVAHSGSRSLCVVNTNPAIYVLARQAVRLSME